MFSNRKPRSYSHKPIYWDKQKEEMEERKKRISCNDSVDENIALRKQHIKGKFIQASAHLNKKQKNKINTFSTIKVISLIIILIATIYFLYIN